MNWGGRSLKHREVFLSRGLEDDLVFPVALLVVELGCKTEDGVGLPLDFHITSPLLAFGSHGTGQRGHEELSHESEGDESRAGNEEDKSDRGFPFGVRSADLSQSQTEVVSID